MNAYAMLQNFIIIKSEKGKLTSAVNFGSASKIGVQKYVERELARYKGLTVSRRKRRKLNLAVVTAAVAMAGYFIRKIEKAFLE